MALTKKIFYLKKTYAPLGIISSLILGKFNKDTIQKPYRYQQSEFRKITASLSLSNDWFTNNIPYWLYTFNKYNILSHENIKVLEIGSWEGLSSYFILHSLPNATLTCVDTWEGADEHKSGDASTENSLNNIEKSFDKNLSEFENRLIKYKGTSFSFFNDNPEINTYDIIYIDGSHHCDDVIVDAIKGFEMLKIGGIMIFDDYMWEYYPKSIENPAAAINSFLRLKKGSYKIVRTYYQLIIEKVASS